MKQRARRAMILTAALGAIVTAVLVIANWGTVREHVEAWHFQLTRKTETIEPGTTPPVPFTRVARPLASWASSSEGPFIGIVHLDLLGILASYSERAVIYEEDGALCWIRQGQTLGGADVVQLLNDNRYRLLEQRFPRRAYVVIRDPTMLRSGPTVFLPTGDPVE